MTDLMHHVAGTRITTEQQALDQFWAEVRAHNSNRMKDPEDLIHVTQVRQRNRREGFDVFYRKIETRGALP